MNYRSKIVSRDSFVAGKKYRATRHGFTLMESMAAIALLAFIGASAWVVMDRCMMSAADSTRAHGKAARFPFCY